MNISMATKPNEFVSDQWQDYQRRARWFFWSAFLGLPVGLFCFWSLDAGRYKIATAILGVTWVIAFLGTSLYLQFFPCPNCGKPFGFKYTNALPLGASRCVHCGLPKWEH